MNKKRQKQLTVRMNEDLYNAAMWKCGRMGISLSNLVKIFLRSFVSQRGVGFYVGPYLKDLFDLNR